MFCQDFLLLLLAVVRDFLADLSIIKITPVKVYLHNFYYLNGHANLPRSAEHSLPERDVIITNHQQGYLFLEIRTNGNGRRLELSVSVWLVFIPSKYLSETSP